MEAAVKIIKLINGEVVLALTDVTSETMISQDTFTVVDPVTVRAFKHAEGGIVYESLVMQHWISMAESSSMIIPTYHVVTIATPKESVTANYYKFIEEAAHPSSQYEEAPDYIDPDDDMFDDFMGDSDEEDQDDREKPTYH